MDFINAKEGEREQTARWEIVFHNNFSPYAQIRLLSGKGKTDRKSRTATAQWEFPSPKLQPQKSEK